MQNKKSLMACWWRAHGNLSCRSDIQAGSNSATRTIDLPSFCPSSTRRSAAGLATALPRGHIHMRSIYGIDANVGEPLSFGTLIAVRLGNVGELLDPIQVGFGSRTFFHANIGSDVSFLKPGQKLPIPVRRVGSNRLWEAPASFR